jgi:hypothetical protein
MNRRYRVRANPTGSFFGGVVGIVFICIGIFVAIPHVGLFGVFWTVLATGITIANFYNAFSDRGIANEIIEEEITPSPASPTPRLAEPHNVESRLRQLDDLRNNGLITADEYTRRRAEILQEV